MSKPPQNFSGARRLFYDAFCSWPLSLTGAALLVLLSSSLCLFADPPPASLPPSVPAERDIVTDDTNHAVASTNGLSPADVTNSMDALDDKYELSIGDRLSFKIVEDNEESKPMQVTDSGDLEFPYIGRIPVAGKTCKQLAMELKAQYENEYYYHATVIVAVDFKAKSQGKVYLIGAVRAPGPQEIPSDEQFTLSKAILRAGGFTDFADQHGVRVTRKQPGSGSGGNKNFIVDVGKILSKGRNDLDLVLEPNDFVYIPEKMIRF